MAKYPTRKELAALEEAQFIVYDAWEASTAKQRKKLAQKAVAISPFCADALLILAEFESGGSKEKRNLLKQAMDVGRLALGEAAFVPQATVFWGELETRPFMRACHYLVLEYLLAGESDEAISLMRDMLQLNPNDNQGIRYILSDSLISRGEDDAARTLHEVYKDDASGHFQWNGVLLSFRKYGDGRETSGRLRAAMKWNKLIASYLTGSKALPKTNPQFIELGGASEAVEYVRHSASNWSATTGAIDWLKNQMPNAKRKST